MEKLKLKIGIQQRIWNYGANRLSGSDPHPIEMTPEQFKKILEDNLIKLKEIYKNNNAITGRSKYIQRYIELEHWHINEIRGGFTVKVEVAKMHKNITVTTSHTNNKTWEKLIKQTEVCIKKLCDGQELSSTDFGVIITSCGNNKFKIKGVKLWDTSICPKCGVVTKDLDEHMLKSICDKRAMETQQAKDSYSQLKYTKHLNAIVRSGVPYRRIPITYRYYVPDGVHTAIKAFKEQKARKNDAEGFAGLTLEQYLNKMFSDQTAQTQTTDKNNANEDSRNDEQS